MAKGTEIVLAGEPQGVFLEGIISGTPKPGTIMQIKAATTPVAGRFTYEARSTTAGSKGLIAVLLKDSLQGKTETDAYVSGTRGFLYCPLMGEDLNCLVGDVAGTADDVAIGDLFGVNNDGTLKANSSYTSAPFAALEVVTDPTAAYLLWVKYLGNNA